MYSKRENLSIWERTKSHFLFCATISSVHGIAHIVRKNVSLFERLFWALLVIAAISWSIVLGLEALERYETRPTVTSVERDHWNWNSTFPSTTICFNTLNTQSVDKIMDDLKLIGNARTEFEQFLEVLAFGGFREFSTFSNYSKSSIYFQVESYAKWVIDTRYAFESNALSHTFGEIFFHGQNEIPDYYTTGHAIEEATDSTFHLTLIHLHTPPEVKLLTVDQRQCRLRDEGILRATPIYSHHLCYMECRMRAYLKICNCTPYYFKRIENEPICDPDGMYCLFQRIDEVEALGLYSCDCLPNCDEYGIIINTVDTSSWFLGTNIGWLVVEYPNIRYKRSIIFSASNLIVQFGGTAGLFLGASILSVVEVIFFITLRLFWAVFRRRQIEQF
ncbi:hypothetical protein RI129_000226 [Pyrocoelia pectoralis]|uniref:Sodium channel protein Nach n=1 Tax=Pyrocoelia pectoralis TaxID=417401 RepID=A0AAN7VIW4_9COLE